MAKPLPLVSDPIDSCALDWLQTSYKFANNNRLDDLYADVLWLVEHFAAGGDWSRPVPGMHFTHSRRHEAGVVFSYTPWQSAAGEIQGARNEGVASLEMSGKFLGSLDAASRQQLYVALKRIPGFFRCNRMDCQITVTNPVVGAQDVVELVERGLLWPKGFGRGQAYVERLQGGQIVGGATQYFGAKGSRVRSRTYDKAAEQGWPVPAVRFELQERAEPARDHFNWLARRCENERFPDPLLVTAEETTVRAVLADGLDFRDTSAWAGGERPKNWAQFAPVPDWWKETVATTVSPIAVQYRKPVDLEATREASLNQYGRKLALEFLRVGATTGSCVEVEGIRYALCAAQRLRRDDLALLLSLVPEEAHERARWLFFGVLEEAARHTEGLVSETGEPPSCLTGGQNSLSPT